MVLPLAAILAVLFSFSYRNNPGVTQSLPRPLVVLIDPGHGAGTGARDGRLIEDDLVLELAKKIREKSAGRNIQVLLTRESNSNPSLAERKAIAAKINADLFISLHTAAGKQEDGISVYVPSKRNSVQSNSLATALINKFRTVHKTKETLNKSSMSIFVLEQLTIPSVLIEMGNVSHGKDQQFLGDETNLDKLAVAILDGISAYPALTYTDTRIVLADTTKPVPEEAVNKNKKEKKEAPKEPLYVIDGKADTSVHSWNVDARYTKEMIESVNVLKGPAATEKYGYAAVGGAIEITLRIPKENPVRGVPAISVTALRTVDVTTFLKLEPGMEIVSFTFTIDLADGSIASVHNAGNTFHPKIKELISNAVPGRYITLDYVRVKLDGRERKIPSRIYEVVE
jgi:N-acetylmuramoyl-L-alanine amidase